jgi:hypothetical protein
MINDHFGLCLELYRAFSSLILRAGQLGDLPIGAERFRPGLRGTQPETGAYATDEFQAKCDIRELTYEMFRSHFQIRN